MTRPCVLSRAWSESEGWCGYGLSVLELKKTEEATEGKEDTESEDGLSGGEGSALDRGDDEGTELGPGGGISMVGKWRDLTVDTLVLMLSSIVVVVGDKTGRAIQWPAGAGPGPESFPHPAPRGRALPP